MKTGGFPFLLFLLTLLFITVQHLDPWLEPRVPGSEEEEEEEEEQARGKTGGASERGGERETEGVGDHGSVSREKEGVRHRSGAGRHRRNRVTQRWKRSSRRTSATTRRLPNSSKSKRTSGGRRASPAKASSKSDVDDVRAGSLVASAFGCCGRSSRRGTFSSSCFSDERRRSVERTRKRAACRRTRGRTARPSRLAVAGERAFDVVFTTAGNLGSTRPTCTFEWESFHFEKLQSLNFESVKKLRSIVGKWKPTILISRTQPPGIASHRDVIAPASLAS
ncbi:uncharacterized protein LOC133483632 isoform X1 [Phyllopteryx taeniolatus]|uniref:uncharacterized protein LOC133483632 isoform X1 n=1 Tax=Phyllopteryx taeniolatus TaxID=161469 RepID=UPI002AD21A57|nr:uncharacterized protein LOC133483632 isoform X1 [Phyllopteryx taeniolatus]